MTDAWAAYCLDEAVYAWGTHVESEMDQAEEEVKDLEAKTRARKAKFLFLMSDEPLMSGNVLEPTPKPKGSYADPAALFSKADK